MKTSAEELVKYCQDVAQSAHAASSRLAIASTEQKNAWLRTSATRLRAAETDVLAANQADIEAAPDYGLTEAQIDRLRLTPDRLENIAQALEQIAELPDPIGEVVESRRRPNGLQITRVRVPLGVVFFVYESRPNVTADAAAICVKSGNAVILRGGKEAAHSSRAIVDLLVEGLPEFELPSTAVQLVSTRDREAVRHFLNLSQYIDLAIPRGGEGLIRRVASEATMPVIKHFSGNCHVFVDRFADLEMASRLVIDSKCQRIGVCNACESLLIDEAIAESFLPRVAELLQERGVQIRGDEATCRLVPGAQPATEDDYAAEYLDLIISVRVVPTLSAAVDHINRHGSGHTDAIVTENLRHAQQFTATVDSAAVLVNASTRFHDGAEFGLGAEIGISTDKYHARGPCGLRELTSYKYVVYGDGQTRS